MFELENLPDLLRPCGVVFPRQESDQYSQYMQDILVTKSDILPHSQEVGLYDSVGSVIQLENFTPVTPPFTIETLLSSEQYLAQYNGLQQHNIETGSLSKLSELEIQQLLCSLSPVSQPPESVKVRSTEELTRLLTPIIEDCVKRNIEGILNSLTDRLFQRTQSDLGPNYQQNITPPPPSDSSHPFHKKRLCSEQRSEEISEERSDERSEEGLEEKSNERSDERLGARSDERSEGRSDECLGERPDGRTEGRLEERSEDWLKLSEELGRTVRSLGLSQEVEDREKVWHLTGCGLELQDFYIDSRMTGPGVGWFMMKSSKHFCNKSCKSPSDSVIKPLHPKKKPRYKC